MGYGKQQLEVRGYRGQIPSPGRLTVAWRQNRVGSGRQLLRGDDRECSHRCRRVVAGWFSVVPPCWWRESTTARDGFGVASCPQMSAERIRLRATAPRRTRDAVACVRSRRTSACVATASSSVIIASFGGAPCGPNRPESSPTVRGSAG
jgi:hypothetical protein